MELTMSSGSIPTVALAGNPNVGKSTIFNALTGMHQHTGNWPGKTVAVAQGVCRIGRDPFVLVDLPGTYSLMAHSPEEEIARNFICFDAPDAVVVVCDATCLERNLNLVLQTTEICSRVVVCVNLLDEAKRNHISVDLTRLSRELGVPVVGTVARDSAAAEALAVVVESTFDAQYPLLPYRVRYPEPMEAAVEILHPAVDAVCPGWIDRRWLCLRLLEGERGLLEALDLYTNSAISLSTELQHALTQARALLTQADIDAQSFADILTTTLMDAAARIAAHTVHRESVGYRDRDLRLDRLLTARHTGYPVMIALLAVIFWLTIQGANVPSELLSRFFGHIQTLLEWLLVAVSAPAWLQGVVIQGLFRVVSWVVSVMLPPMAIFFPLFTLLEDVGYLPRIAFNLDRPFHRCHACGKQALTICMGFGCNAAGVVGCRIIDSPRERMLAILTNNFVPCNGRFPILIALLSMFFVGTSGGLRASILSAVFLTLLILLGIGMTFLTTRILSATVLRGIPSAYTLELPPFRRPQIGQVIVRSVFDRTLFVLGRAVTVAAPAGACIWIAANIHWNGMSLLAHCAAFLDPFARLMGLDGVILMAFLLGFPANEIVLPLMLMIYLSQGSIPQLVGLNEIRAVLVQNGWTWMTAVSTMLFCLFHWPCSTTVLTVRKESGSWRWALAAIAIPTLTGILLCMAFTAVAGLFV